MRSVSGDAFLDENGELFITVPGVRDPFAQPNSPEPEPVLKATGFTFEDVPTYGWPLSIFYANNQLQFASEYTARAIGKLIAGALPKSVSASQSLDVVKVGPFTRAAIRKITLADGDGVLVILNAGEEANQYARDAQEWRARLLVKLDQARAKRDSEPV